MRTPHLSRRLFLQQSAAFAAIAAVAQPAWAQTATRPKLGIQLYSLRGYKVDDALNHAKNLGFEQVEFYSGMLELNSSDEAIRAMREQVASLGMSISAHGVNHISKDVAASRRLFEFAKKLGVPTITADPDPDSFDSLDELVKEFDIRVAIHNHGPGHRYNKVVDVLNAIEGHDERIGACADLGHFIRSGENAVDVVRALKGRLYGIHLKDFAEMKQNTKGVILGQGHLDCEELFAALQAVNFPANGALSLEYEENPSNPLDEIKQCVAVASTAMTKVYGA